LAQQLMTQAQQPMQPQMSANGVGLGYKCGGRKYQRAGYLGILPPWLGWANLLNRMGGVGLSETMLATPFVDRNSLGISEDELLRRAEENGTTSKPQSESSPSPQDSSPREPSTPARKKSVPQEEPYIPTGVGETDIFQNYMNPFPQETWTAREEGYHDTDAQRAYDASVAAERGVYPVNPFSMDRQVRDSIDNPYVGQRRVDPVTGETVYDAQYIGDDYAQRSTPSYPRTDTLSGPIDYNYMFPQDLRGVGLDTRVSVYPTGLANYTDPNAIDEYDILSEEQMPDYTGTTSTETQSASDRRDEITNRIIADNPEFTPSQVEKAVDEAIALDDESPTTPQAVTPATTQSSGQPSESDVTATTSTDGSSTAPSNTDKPVDTQATTDVSANTPDATVSDEGGIYGLFDRLRRMRDSRNDLGRASREYKPWSREWLRYAPALQSGIAALTDVLGITNVPDYSNAEIIENSVQRPNMIGFTPVGMRQRYNPVDARYYNAILQREGASNRRAVTDMANSNRATALAQLSSQNRGTQEAMGQLGLKIDEQNNAQRNAVIAANNALEQANAERAMKIEAQNQGVMQNYYNALANARLRGATLRESIAENASTAKAENLVTFAENLGNIGHENWMARQIEENPYFAGYSIDPVTGEMNFNPIAPTIPTTPTQSVSSIGLSSQGQPIGIEPISITYNPNKRYDMLGGQTINDWLSTTPYGQYFTVTE